MSAYVFSTENWQRSREEVKHLMGLVLRLLSQDLPEFHKYNIRLKILGSTKGVDKKIVAAINKAEQETSNNTAGTLALCFNYGGHLEIADACREIIELGVDANKVTPELIEQHLYAPDIPPVDMVVRTSGEQRLSNFMLWRAAYSELMFIDKPWPNMEVGDVKAVIEEFNNRSRRFGK